jgi:hypothetical protein
MDRLSRERDDDAVRREPEAPAPETVQAGSLAWASAVGNQAVQRLARQELETEELAEPEAEAEEGEPEEVAALTSAGLGVEDAAGLAAVDDLAEDELPE